MANYGKNINMFLMTGDVTGIIKCTFANWNGVVYKIPKTELKSKLLAEREDLKQSGIYFLIGKVDKTDTNYIYIGQGNKRKNGEGVLYRVCEHINDKHGAYFTDVVILASQTEGFGATEISFLENQFTLMAKEVDRYTVRNGNEPNPGNVTEEKISDLKEVIDNTKIIMGALGYRIFVPMTNSSSDGRENTNEMKLFLRKKNKNTGLMADAKCLRTNEGFVVLAGSVLDLEDRDSLAKGLKEKRSKLIKEGIIVGGVLQKDQFFDTPSGASVFVLGRSSNGKTDWKDESGQPLGER